MIRWEVRKRIDHSQRKDKGEEGHNIRQSFAGRKRARHWMGLIGEGLISLSLATPSLLYCGPFMPDIELNLT